MRDVISTCRQARSESPIPAQEWSERFRRTCKPRPFSQREGAWERRQSNPPLRAGAEEARAGIEAAASKERIKERTPRGSGGEPGLVERRAM